MEKYLPFDDGWSEVDLYAFHVRECSLYRVSVPSLLSDIIVEAAHR